MQKVLLATHNPAKIKRFKDSPITGIEMVSPQDLNLEKVYAEENGQDETENAKIKAKAYFEASQTPSISLDTGFYIENLPPQKQPGKHVQRAAGVTDETSPQERFEKMTKFYTNIAKENGGFAKAYFKDVFCLYDGSNYFFAEAKREALLTTKVFKVDTNFPIASIYIVSQFNKYYHELNKEEMKTYIKPSTDAFQSLLSKYLKKF